MLRRFYQKSGQVDGRPFNSHHGSESFGKTGAQQEHPLASLQSSVHHPTPGTHPSDTPQTSSGSVPRISDAADRAALGKQVEVCGGIAASTCPSDLPEMNPAERKHLSELAGREFANDREAYEFWMDLVERVVFIRLLEGKK